MLGRVCMLFVILPLIFGVPTKTTRDTEPDISKVSEKLKSLSEAPRGSLQNGENDTLALPKNMAGSNANSDAKTALKNVPTTGSNTASTSSKGVVPSSTSSGTGFNKENDASKPAQKEIGSNSRKNSDEINGKNARFDNLEENGSFDDSSQQTQPHSNRSDKSTTGPNMNSSDEASDANKDGLSHKTNLNTIKAKSEVSDKTATGPSRKSSDEDTNENGLSHKSDSNTSKPNSKSSYKENSSDEALEKNANDSLRHSDVKGSRGSVPSNSGSGGSKRNKNEDGESHRVSRQVSAETNPKEDSEEVVDLRESQDSSKMEESRPNVGSKLIGNSFGGGQKAFKNGVDVLKSSTLGTGGVILGGLTTAEKGVTNGAQNVRNFAEKQLGTTRKLAGETVGNIKDLASGRIQAGLDTAKDTGKSLQDGAKTFGTNVAKRASNVANFAQKELATAQTGAKETADNVGGLFFRGFNTAKDVARDTGRLATRAVGVGQKAFGGFSRGFEDWPKF